jgi:MFS family permease
LKLLRKRPLIIFAGCVMLFHLANAVTLPLMGGVLTTRSSQWATILIAACIVGPQLLVAIFSPAIGRKAQVWGRRPLLLAAFAALALRGLLFATVPDPYLLVAAQVLDGVSAASASFKAAGAMKAAPFDRRRPGAVRRGSEPGDGYAEFICVDARRVRSFARLNPPFARDFFLSSGSHGSHWETQ